MPELPEVEHLRRTLLPQIVGAHVQSVLLRRSDILQHPHSGKKCSPETALLVNGVIASVLRKGKNLAIIVNDGRVLGVHLGMSGQVRVGPAAENPKIEKHEHCEWLLKQGRTRRRMIFKDPRRFGGLCSYPTFDALEQEKWNFLGPDALTVTGSLLHDRCCDSMRPIKAALLDQNVLAGVGNIYADEALFRSRINPRKQARRISISSYDLLARAIVAVLTEAIDSGGSTVRSYLDANGNVGDFVKRHQVYGRTGLDCVRCGKKLRSAQVAQRTTVWCVSCQSE
ncbi:MAG TPA: bifunctional DNA-formamidopyrimidine glycosylase/DNA-(apurinic or apyrimidinic site) lyase [Phycisphaerales bacterium]|nr:bifunctional DNA-formamidopyrimidine glycosylase/DNA-(apurinic or apyrimidinic site) lyase [Phycisphaerales bacterium]